MASHIYSLLPTLVAFCVIIGPAASISKTSFLVDRSSRATLRHVDSSKNLTRLELIKRAVDRSNRRMEGLKAMVTGTTPSAETLVTPGSGEYLMDVSIGTPAIAYSAILDTGSDLIWTQCKPCYSCFQQSAPIFDPSKSSTYKNLSCSSYLCQVLSDTYCMNTCIYQYAYGGGAYTVGFLASETLTLGKTVVHNVGFGCGVNNYGVEDADGLVGMGRGPLSLVSQLDEPKFSYCLTPPYSTVDSLLLLGSYADKLPNNDKTLLTIPPGTFSLNSDGTGGTIVDSGTTIFYMNTTAYNLVADKLAKEIKLKQVNLASETGLNLCWEMPKSNYSYPTLTMHFDNADWVLSSNNYMLEETSLGATCLAVLPSSQTIFGNVAQHGNLVHFDVSKNVLSFVPTNCKTL
ncbi:Aspartic proteinase nepenthesin-1-like protein [Drosera capensis]